MFENNTLVKKFFENLYFLVSYVFSVSKLILWYLNMSTIDLATWFKIGMYLLDREKRLNVFPRSTNIIQVLNELLTDKRHIKVSQNTAMPYTHQEQEETVGFFLIKCVTRPDLSGVPLINKIEMYKITQSKW